MNSSNLKSFFPQHPNHVWKTEHNKKKKDITQMALETRQSKRVFFSLFRIQLDYEVLRTKIKGGNVGPSEVYQQGVF